jgi:hypothetical protein
MYSRSNIFLLISILFILFTVEVGAQTEPLPAWRDTANRRAIVEFVESTTIAGPQFVPAAQRIAVFDNDGTLWGEQPMYFQLAFVLDQLEKMAPEHPEWKTQEPFRSVLANDLSAALADKKNLMQLLMATHAETTTEEFAARVRQWLQTARHPTSGKPYTHMVYQPMLELLDYLRAHEYKTFIVSGGGIEFMRVFAEDVYGIPPEQVVGSSIKTHYEVGDDGVSVLRRDAAMDFLDDGPGKPVGINLHIGRRPVLAFGNSDGDFQMLEWTTAGQGPRLACLIHHDDAAREVAYDRDSHIGRLQRGLDEAAQRRWLIVSMQKDWQRIYPTQ